MPLLLLGELAGLAAAVAWSVSSTSFTVAGRAIGSLNVNRWRLVFAVVYLSLFHLMLRGTLLPLGASTEAWAWLTLSAVIGLVLGDSLLFRSFVIIGPRSAMVLMTLNPVFGAILGYFVLGQVLSPLQIVAMLITVAGVSWAIRYHSEGLAPSQEGSRGLGVVAGILAALAQATGLVFTRKGLDAGVTAFSATLMRMLVAMGLLWALTLIQKRGKAKPFALLRDRKALGLMALGSFVGPFLGMWMSLVAVQYAPVGIAATLMSTTSLFLIPISHLVLGERIRRESIAGTVLAVLGVALLLTVAR